MLGGIGFILLAFWVLLVLAWRDQQIDRDEMLVLIALYAASLAGARYLQVELWWPAGIVLLLNSWLIFRLDWLVSG